jgi:hypothetical protein
MSVSIEAVYQKAIQKYYADAERVGITPEHPLDEPVRSVDVTRRIVSLHGHRGLLAAYSFKVSPQGILSFRPLWNY